VVQDTRRERDLEPSTCTVGAVGQREVAAAALDQPAHEREPYAARPDPAALLRGEPGLEDLLAQLGSDAAAGVGHTDPQAAAALAQQQLDPGRPRRAAGSGVERVVEEVAEHGQRSSRVRELAVEARAVVEAQLDAALARNG
jgi:hypothetical protein